LLRAKPQYFLTTLCGVVLIGFLFSIRSLVMRFIPDCALWCTSELLYLENMPTVLFSALFLIGWGIRQVLSGRTTLKDFAVFYVALLLAMVPIAAMALTLQRASIGAVVIYIVVIIVVTAWRRPYRALTLVGAMALWLLLIDLSVGYVFEGLSQKTQEVGFNMRPQEFAAVWDKVRADPMIFMFGAGWGSHFNSPAVGGLSVNFTHNFFTSILLKTGFFGLILAIAYIGGLLERLTRVIFRDYILGLALLAPILIDLTLYASFKSLDFGLVLLMISGSLVYFRQSESLRHNMNNHA